MSKDNRVFLKSKSLSLFIVLKRTSIGVHKKISFINTSVWPNIFWPSGPVSSQCVLSYTGQAILVRKVNIHAYSMYVLLADKVSCPMTQHFDTGDSQINNPSIPSLTL